MNRIIKFRAWDTKNQKWLDAVPVLEYLLDDEEAAVSHHDIDEMDALYFNPQNPMGKTFNGRVIYQQFTGQIDKNGKEIYEGDIIKLDENHFVAKVSDRLHGYTCGVIKWVYTGFNVCQKRVGRTELCEFCIDGCPCGLIVLGNILENSELIEK